MATRVIKKLKKVVGGEDLIVWGDPTKISPYIPGFTEVAAEGPVNISVTRSGSSVRRYPGDPSPYSRSGGLAVRVKAADATRTVLPGRNAYLEEVTEFGNRVVQTITFEGPFARLHAAATAAATRPFTLRSPGGKAYAITDATP